MMSGKQALLHQLLARVVTGGMSHPDECENEAAGRARAAAEEASQMPKRGERIRCKLGLEPASESF